MNDEDAIEGLKRLGLTTYEARVFLALQKLGRGAASEISDVADVPRSQVYGAAEGLEERGLIETQQSTPTVYRPVSLEQARRLLLDQLAETGAETFDYLDTIQDTHEQDEHTESIWLLNGADAITSRVAELIQGADERVLYATDDPDNLDDGVHAALEATAEDGVTVVLASLEPAVLAQIAEDSPIRSYRVPEDRDMDVDVAQLLMVDDDTLLLSSYSAAGRGAEVAFWTSENIFATVMVELVTEWFREPFDADPPEFD
ncbi:TrmB family transcriptional regulator [Halovenus sp. WSH3]|uniref:TrmB family transcriptional regulator n=1 Tax=Halovenus carboxidivorans TaxID=2692199 RepID=A0A6B0T7B8_9EURY|nr:helix-turn-helix domain-containing protein [Halovenus carboxidivorans]MXR51483.1 TrmB family transcriptional regulator [Halovenus carboxidivorans]